MEKRMRNRIYARRYKLGKVGVLPLLFLILYLIELYQNTALARKRAVIEYKRSVIAQNEVNFYNELFEHTTDADLPPYDDPDFKQMAIAQNHPW